MVSLSFIRKAAIVAIAAVSINVAANAQMQGEKAVGGNLVFGSGDSYSNFGIGAKFFYNVTDPIRLAGEFDYFLKKDYVSFWDFSVYGHYLFSVAEGVNVFPAVGLGMMGIKVDLGPFGNASDSKFAFSLGGGADYALNESLILTGELRLKLYDGNNRVNFAVGLAYRF